MNYQENRVIANSILLIMVVVVLTFILTIGTFLFVVFRDISITSPPSVQIYQYNSTESIVREIGDSVFISTPRPKPTYESPDLYLLAKIINAEALDQPYDGKIAVGNVILNRVKSPKYPNSIKDVVYQKGQFSPVADGSINKTPTEESIQAAKDVLNGVRVVDETVMFYYNPAISTSQWIYSRQIVLIIDDHAFAI